MSWFITIDTDLNHLAEVMLVRFVHWRVTISFFPYCAPQKNIANAPLMLREWAVLFPLLRME